LTCAKKGEKIKEKRKKRKKFWCYFLDEKMGKNGKKASVCQKL